jgi:hypothetical protein
MRLLAGVLVHEAPLHPIGIPAGLTDLAAQLLAVRWPCVMTRYSTLRKRISF